MPKVVWLNGTLSPLETAAVPVADHAHLYGDGLFEGIRFYSRRVFKLREHLTRLYVGCRALGYEMTMPVQELEAAIVETCKAADLPDGYIRLNVTRGTGLGLDPKNIDRTPNVMILVSTLSLYPPESYERGLDVVTCTYRVIAPDALDPRIKCIGRYAGNILAKMEANAKGAGEGLMLNAQGIVAECTGDNIFLVKDRIIQTPASACGILEGITRNTVIDLARSAGYAVVEGFYTRYDIFNADEAFLTGTAAEVIPMVTLDERPIGNGLPGDITREVMGLFHGETAHGVPF
jgi:branched-chain amino acid aminotransferase